MACARRHSFDIARAGYINLLQPQDRRSRNPGDTAAAVAGRQRLHERGVMAPLRAGITELLSAGHEDVVLDAGCGDGYYLGDCAAETHGVDISVPAIELAAKRYPRGEWIVANADRFVPYADRSFSRIMSITARMHPPEFRRVLREDGRLLVALPSPEDLVELRGRGRDRVARTVDEFAGEFRLSRQERVTTTADLDASAVEDVLHSIYRPLRTGPAAAMPLTFSLDLLLFRLA